MELKRTLFATLLTAALIAPFGAAQASELSANYSAPALGSDMWNGYMGRMGLFVPHYDDCDTAGEAFVAVAPDGKGFCIEAAERTASYWEDARDDCFNQGMRLPEVGEYIYACRRAGTLGLTAMTDDWEWAGNAPSFGDKGTYYGVSVYIAGSGGCDRASYSWIGREDGDSRTRTYRCVR